MKRLLFLSILAVGVAFGGARENVGCGLGTQLWKHNADNSILRQSLAATTNATFGNQTFGITSGTSGCRKPHKFVDNNKLQKFIADNMDQVAIDISAGKGATLDTIADLLKVPHSKRPIFYSKLKSNFNQIYSSSAVDSAKVIDSIAENI